MLGGTMSGKKAALRQANISDPLSPGAGKLFDGSEVWRLQSK
jgi:hypothetical protein